MADKVGDDVETADEVGDDEAASQSLLDRMSALDRWREDAVPALSPNSHPATLDPDVDIDPILPDGWREEQRRRRRKRRKRREPRPWMRRARWSLLGLLLLAGVTAAAVLILVPRYAESIADGVVADYREALDTVATRIPPTQTALEQLTSPDLDRIQLDQTVPAFTRFRASALALSDTVRKPLPDTPPLLPRDVIDDLAPVRARISLVAGRADVVSGRLGRLVTYRTLLSEAFVLPADLPLAAEAAEINELSLTLAAMLADSLDATSRLPTDPFLDSHRAEVAETLDWYRTWEVEYLQALRRDSPAVASAMINQARSRAGRLRIGLEPALVSFRDWGQAELAGLGSDLAATRVLVLRPED